MSHLKKQLEKDLKRERKSSEKSLPEWAKTSEEKPLKVKKKKKAKK